MTLQPFPVASSNGNNSMQMPRIVIPQPSPPRAGSKPINTFNFTQLERYLTQRLIFWGETRHLNRATKAKMWLNRLFTRPF